ncbi:bifunctional UDP-N-acetylglucosamine diphosphorylase/glucosamine-1-phosphate N-acetyltransferase GlmU [Desulfothermus sp.]
MRALKKKICALVLSAGKGTRMKSELPKVLHRLLDEPMLWYVDQSLKGYFDPPDIFYVLGYKFHMIEQALDFVRENKIYQKEQLGTGHALQCAYDQLLKKGYDWVLVVNGDVPLLDMDKIWPMIDRALQQNIHLSFLTINLDDPTGYGRVIRNEMGQVVGIIEQKDIQNSEIEKINEVNCGIYFINLKELKDYLFKLDCNNKQREYYLTDLIELFVRDKKEVYAYNLGKQIEFLGVNSCSELALCDEILQKKIVGDLLNRGVLIYRPELVRIGPRVQVDSGVQITGPTEIYGKSSILKGTKIDSHVWIKDSIIDEDCKILSFSHIDGAHIGEGCTIGPFARLRPGTELVSDIKVGNFVEIKKSILQKGVKASHLTYLGDSFIGEGTNIGAGTITCNYDGKNKHQTYIGKDVFVGSNTSLVAPLKIGDRALIGAGSTITKDVPEGCLAVARQRQKNITRKIKK